MVEAASSRTVIRDELRAFAESHIAKWDDYANKEFRCSDHGFDYVSRQTEHNGCILTVAKAIVPGFTLEMHRTFREDILN